LVVLLVSALLAGVAIWRAGGEALALARIGAQFSEGDPQGTQGYDGQFVYYIALDPNPTSVAARLDSPAYRYQRILLPLLARLIAFGQAAAIPWVLAGISVLALALGTWAVSELLGGWKVNRWYSLVYGFWAGFLLAVIVDLPEPLAYGLVAGSLLALERRRKWLGWILLGLALFAKEVSVLFLLALLAAYLAEKNWRDAARLALVAGLPFSLFQAWLWWTFGQPGLASGGAMATPFELLPFAGLFKIGAYSLTYLAAMLVVFGPAVILPSLWGVWTSGRFWRSGDRSVIVASLFLNALVIFFVPFSTFRETGGILRFASGLMLATLLFAGRYRLRRVLNYSVFWIVLNVFLLK